MSTAERLNFDDNTMWVELSEGQTLGVPLVWLPKLLNATSEQRNQYQITHSGKGLHWGALDEHISVESLLDGQIRPVTGRADRFFRIFEKLAVGYKDYRSYESRYQYAMQLLKISGKCFWFIFATLFTALALTATPAFTEGHNEVSFKVCLVAVFVVTAVAGFLGLGFRHAGLYVLDVIDPDRPNAPM